ncbi:MAG TPA: hypothetical protein VIC56_04975, partial [Gemmatimonadota bacterium]
MPDAPPRTSDRAVGRDPLAGLGQLSGLLRKPRHAVNAASAPEPPRGPAPPRDSPAAPVEGAEDGTPRGESRPRHDAPHGARHEPGVPPLRAAALAAAAAALADAGAGRERSAPERDEGASVTPREDADPAGASAKGRDDEHPGL